ncbi:MAG: hypothetical protein K8I27_06785 [Planctomycetes bacterium]|nr:hypothetical protein [Planctomycetota bacterium]
MMIIYELSSRAVSLARHALQVQSAVLTDTGFLLECYAAALNLDHGSAVLDRELGVLRAVHGQLAARSLWLISAVVINTADDVRALAAEARRLQNPELHQRALARINADLPIRTVECAVAVLFRRNRDSDTEQPDLRDWWWEIQDEGFGRVGLKDWHGNIGDWPDGMEFDYAYYVCSFREQAIREHELWFGAVHQAFPARGVEARGTAYKDPFEIFI